MALTMEMQRFVRDRLNLSREYLEKEFLKVFAQEIDPHDRAEWLNEIWSMREKYRKWGYKGPRFWVFRCSGCEMGCMVKTRENYGPPRKCIYGFDIDPKYHISDSMELIEEDHYYIPKYAFASSMYSKWEFIDIVEGLEEWADGGDN